MNKTGAEGVCVCVFVCNFLKNRKRDCAKLQTAGSALCSGPYVFALGAFYDKSLYDSRAPTLLCATIHFYLFQGRLTVMAL